MPATIRAKLFIIGTAALFSATLLLTPWVADAATNITHKPLKYFVAEKRIQIVAKVADKSGVIHFRCYFRAAEGADFMFVAMEKTGKKTYRCILPAPRKDTDQIEYLFLVVDGDNQVGRTETYTTHRRDDKKTPAWQAEAGSAGSVHVSSELDDQTNPPEGFSDSIIVDGVESTLRFGYVAEGVYIGSKATAAGSSAGAATTSSAAGTTATTGTAATAGTSTTAAAGAGATAGTAATATSAGVVATTAGVSTATVAGVTAGTVAVAGAGAAAGGGGASNGDDPEPTPTPDPVPSPTPNPTPAPTPTPPPSEPCQNVAGAYNGYARGTYCDGSEDGDENLTMQVNPDCSTQVRIRNEDIGFLTIILSGNDFTGGGAIDRTCGEITIQGSFNGNEMTGTYSYQLGGGGTFAFRK